VGLTVFCGAVTNYFRKTQPFSLQHFFTEKHFFIADYLRKNASASGSTQNPSTGPVRRMGFARFGGLTVQRGLDPDGQDQTRAVMGSHHGPAPLAPTARTRMPTRLPGV
jgi:hypothetical protein